ncbi:biotin-independent malonate decarboxylase subunit beta [Rugamonas apoptosis]|uniref:Biotin-independent malonate decarboxylase subunit beta n=1 Tax=Rugamonas apoptosis TaxID=2758570 RepID=A0A7W2FC18_9BURK|nr:biotin-independent malonate decarboxylase subunit beta [Rugamonas apoptosis]MBA5688880.1 biotin-independent malonate decarboxylase subunit beta [Rugamonas apoptosis]
MSSYQAASAHERLHALFDAGSFQAFDAPEQHMASPHLAQFNIPAQPDDGVAVGRARLNGMTVYTAAQEGRFMGGAVGEVHGARLTGLLRRAARDRAAAVVLLIESGGVRLHEANAGLIAISEVMRALLAARAAGVPVVALVGGANGAFGGMGIVASCANVVVMSEPARLAMSGPEVIASANGTAEFDPRDRALVWRTTGGKHRYLLGDCQMLVADDMAAFRQAAQDAIASCAGAPVELTLAALEQEQRLLAARIERFDQLRDPVDIWQALGMPDAQHIPALETQAFIEAAAPHRLGVA